MEAYQPDENNSNVMSAYVLRPCADAEEAKIYLPARSEYERSHKTTQDYQFYKPLIMVSRTLQTRLSLNMLHKSCNKACAMYCIPKLPYFGPVDSTCRASLFRAVYDQWFVPDESCISFGTFAAQLIGCWEDTSPKEVEDLIGMHEEYCAQVKRRHKVLDGLDSQEPSSTLQVKHHSSFELLPTFSAFIIIVDKDNWREEGVLLARTSDEESLVKWPVGKGLVSEERVQRLSLDKAVEFVLLIQRESETEFQKALRLATVVYRPYD